VTGATGYVAGHVIHELLERNYRVRGTVRSLKQKDKYEHIYKIIPEKNELIELVEADLLDDSIWDKVI